MGKKEFRSGYVFCEELVKALRKKSLRIKSECYPDNSTLHTARIKNKKSAHIFISEGYNIVEIEIRVEITHDLSMIVLLENAIRKNWPKRKYVIKRIEMESTDTDELAEELRKNLEFYLDYMEEGNIRLENSLKLYLAEFTKARKIQHER